MKSIDGGVTAPRGFKAAGVAAGIKRRPRKKDCALIVSEAPATVAGMFTTNVMKAPPVLHDIRVCSRGQARAVFINSGNANAATGERGRNDVASTVNMVAETCSIDADTVCVCSTGVIGVPLPMKQIARGIETCAVSLSSRGSLDAAEAIMTTDTVAKEFAIELRVDGTPVRLGAIAKGSGMICPDMATMICVITTDAKVAPGRLRKLLEAAVDVSFHQICVDNDLSTSDTVLVLANGQSGVTIPAGGRAFTDFAAALAELCTSAAKSIVRDGEGATKFVEISVSGTTTDEGAKRIARSIATSQLCKTAFYGEDPNWGRFACAAGYAGVEFDPADLDIYLDDLLIAEGGMAAAFKERDAAAIMKQPEFKIRVAVGEGPGKAEFWTSDLSQGYVSINADYRS